MALNKKGKKQTISPQNITDTGFADYMSLLANTLTKTKSLLQSLEQAKEHKPPPERKQNGVHISYSEMNHLHSEIS